ncbi:TetR family transcriptional regulator [Actinoplanes sp. NPDC026670]|uniref:TetR/AcrR family transcriptional regulator n=1 Tax=Actinoplanes sp. NPDC026670 TaxID=3154700 RepID=UPI0033FF08AF
MPSRQEELLDAAIGVLGSQGVRALTHRAVDAAAGMPLGSAANYFKTKDALISAVVERFAERDRVAWQAIAGFVQPSDPGELAAALTAYVLRALGPERPVTVARYGLFVEAALRPALQGHLADSAAELRRWATQWLRAIGSTNPTADCTAIMDYLDGLILHELAFPGPPEELPAAIDRTVRTLCTAGG